MSDFRVKIQEMQDDQEMRENKKWLKVLSLEIEHTKPTSYKVGELRWLFDNYHKIIKNRRLIDLIG